MSAQSVVASGQVPLPNFSAARSGVPASRPISRNEAALVRFDVEVDAFNRMLAAWAGLSQVEIDKLLRAHALDLLTRVQMRTPVLTGRLRASWHMIPPGTARDAFRYSDNQGHGFDGSLTGVSTGPNEVAVGTNVEYALPVEAGSSRKAPSGMLAVSVAEKTGQLEQQIERRLSQLWDAAGERASLT